MWQLWLNAVAAQKHKIEDLGRICIKAKVKFQRIRALFANMLERTRNVKLNYTRKLKYD